MGTRYDMTVAAEREEGVAAASRAVQQGDLVVLPTDTVYGVGADAFDAGAVHRLLDAKGRGRQMPPPVLVSARATLDALAVGVPDWARALVEELWPGALTLVVRQQPSLQWDLGETRGTVAVRMPDQDAALELLERTGPLAVSSANLTGHPPATNASDAEAMLGDSVSVLLDDGPTPGPVPSTIVDCTGQQPRMLRAGVIDRARIDSLVERFGVRVPEDE